MRDIFYPESIAVIGVSDKPDNLGRNIVANMIAYGYTGVVHAVGPSGGRVETRRIYKSVAEISDPVDLAIILTPAATVAGILEACGEKGIRRAIIESGGFREFGEQGRKLEAGLVEVAERYGIRFTGPNGLGVINMENGMCAPFPRMKKFIKQGDVSIIAQSGGVGLSALNLMANEGIGLNKFISVGNMLNVTAEDVLEYMITDEGTKTIFLYLETIRDGRRLMEIARRSEKPILAFKANIGSFGQKIAVSHSASLSSNDKVVEAAFKQAGLLRTHDATVIGDGLKITRLPPMRGRNLAIISRSGGHAVIAADACEISGFNLARLPDEFLRRIEKHFRASVIQLTNPLDLGDLFDLDVYAQIVEETLQLESVDGVIFLHTSLGENEYNSSRTLLERLAAMTEKYAKPVAYYLSADAKEIAFLKQQYDFPIFTRVVETVRAMELNYRHNCIIDDRVVERQVPRFEVDRPQVSSLIEKAQAEGRDLLLSEAMDVFVAYGIPIARSHAAANVEEAQAAAEAMGYPVAIKVIAEDVSHKSDLGGVQLNIRTPAGVAAAFDDMMKRIKTAHPAAHIDGVLVQPMVIGGRELILGGHQDPQFGPVLLIGMGGIFVEILREVAVRVAPITRAEAYGMIEELRASQILRGARGRKPSDIDAVVDAMLRLSQLLQDFPQIQEIDINPLTVLHEHQGCLALDGRMVLGG